MDKNQLNFIKCCHAKIITRSVEIKCESGYDISSLNLAESMTQQVFFLKDSLKLKPYFNKSLPILMHLNIAVLFPTETCLSNIFLNVLCVEQTKFKIF